MKVYAWLIDLIHRRKNGPTGMIFRVGPKSDRTPRDNTVYCRTSYLDSRVTRFLQWRHTAHYAITFVPNYSSAKTNENPIVFVANSMGCVGTLESVQSHPQRRHPEKSEKMCTGSLRKGSRGRPTGGLRRHARPKSSTTAPGLNNNFMNREKCTIKEKEQKQEVFSKKHDTKKSQAKPSQAKPSQAKPSQAKPSQWESLSWNWPNEKKDADEMRMKFHNDRFFFSSKKSSFFKQSENNGNKEKVKSEEWGEAESERGYGLHDGNIQVAQNLFPVFVGVACEKCMRQWKILYDTLTKRKKNIQFITKKIWKKNGNFFSNFSKKKIFFF